MFGKKKRAPEPRGAAAARQVTRAAARDGPTTTARLTPRLPLIQMGLLVDLDPDQLLSGADDSLDDPELEAELAALTGGGGGGQRAQQPGGSESVCQLTS